MANPPDDVELPDRGYNTQDLRSVSPQPKRRRWAVWILSVLVLGPALVFGIWAASTLAVSYSRGERAGIVQKFSRKGWLCKTWEGELAMATIPGAVPEKFAFTVRNDSVAALVNTLYREGVRTSLTYEQHRGVPTSCFGETEYYVTGAEAVGGQGAVPRATGATVPGATTPPAGRPSTPSPTPPAPTPTPAPTPAPPR